MRILGLDPGSRYTGYGILDKSGQRLSPRVWGRFSLGKDRDLPDRLARLSRELRALLDEHEPDVAVLESLFGGVNVRSLIVLAQARGALLGILADRGLEIVEYAPAEVKSAVTGNGRADKEQVARMVRMVLGLGKNAVLAVDASDALAVAICAAQRRAIDGLDRRGGGTVRGPLGGRGRGAR